MKERKNLRPKLSARSGVPPRDLASLQAINAEMAVSLTPAEIIEDVVRRYNEMQTAIFRESRWKINPNDPRLHFEMSDKGINNHLAIGFSDKSGLPIIFIGHFDPAQQIFLFCPEIVTVTQAAFLGDVAQTTRNNAMKTETWMDTDAPEIIELRKIHKKALDEDGLIGKITERYNHLPNGDKLAYTEEVIVDNSTSYFVCLTPGFGGYNKNDPMSINSGNAFEIPEANITIALTGDYSLHNGIKLRGESTYIHIGHLDLDKPGRQYAPDNSLVTDLEFAKLLNLAADLVRQKSGRLPTLSTEFVALVK